MYKFHIPSVTWTKLAPNGVIPPARTDHSCIGFGPNLYVFGGFDGKSRFDDFRLYKIHRNEWTEVRDNSGVGSTPCGR